jgi:hypothetical protein
LVGEEVNLATRTAEPDRQPDVLAREREETLKFLVENGRRLVGRFDMVLPTVYPYWYTTGTRNAEHEEKRP